jgi:cobalt/nickel transport system permease protein
VLYLTHGVFFRTIAVMHIPDGFLDVKVIVAATALTAIGVGAAWRQTKKQLPQQKIPLLGLAAAFVFAAQMLNFPVAGGTSGHLLGAVLISVLLGPSAAIIAMAAVLVVQCFLFADGGVLALGANIFNMAVMGVLVGHTVYRSVLRILGGERGRIAAVAVASWGSVLAAALCCAGELAWSGTVAWQTAFPAMAGIHALIGVGEAIIACLVIAAIKKTRPELLAANSGPLPAKAAATVTIYGLVMAFGLVLFVSPFASSWPDGLETVAAKFGFDRQAFVQPLLPSLIPEYKFPGLDSVMFATIVAGIAGVAVVLLLVFFLSRRLKSNT